MKLHIGKDFSVSYLSEREKLIVNILGKRKLTIREIAQEMSGNDMAIGMDAEIKVGNSIRRIIKKCNHYKFNWTLRKTKVEGKLIITKEMI